MSEEKSWVDGVLIYTIRKHLPFLWTYRIQGGSWRVALSEKPARLTADAAMKVAFHDV